MKKLLILPLLVLILFSCSDKDDDDAYLHVDKTKIELDGFYEGSVTINISSSFGWSASVEDDTSSANWMSLDKFSDTAGETTLNVRAMDINEGSDRSCKIRITNGDHKEATIEVKQLALDGSKPFLYADFLDVVGLDSYIKDFNVKSNQDWEITSFPSWIAFSELSGSKSSTVTLTIKENYKYEDRDGEIVFKAKGTDLIYTQKLTQKGRGKAENRSFFFDLEAIVSMYTGNCNVKSYKLYPNLSVKDNVFLGNLIYPKSTVFPSFTFPTGYTYNDISVSATRLNPKYVISPSLEQQKTIAQEALASSTKAVKKDANCEAMRFYSYFQLSAYGMISFAESLDKVVTGKTYEEQEMDYDMGMIFSFSHTLFALRMDQPEQLIKETLSQKDKDEKVSYISSVYYGKKGMLIVEANNNKDVGYEKLHKTVRSLILGTSSITEEEAWELLEGARLSYIYFDNNNQIQILQTTPKEVLETYKAARLNREDKTNIYPFSFEISNLETSMSENFEYSFAN